MDCIAPSMDKIINHCIDQIWNLYDADNSGYLDREEAYRFVQESIKSNDAEERDEKNPKKLTFLEKEKKAAEEDVTKKQFEACFSAVDDDNNGSISKDEMLTFILLVCDIEDIDETIEKEETEI